MGRITGDKQAVIAAPPERCFQIAADLPGSVAWHPALRAVDVHEADQAGRPVIATLTLDAKVRTIETRWRLTYDEPNAIAWTQERGDVKSVTGRWVFETHADGGTHATYVLEVDPGRMLGMLLRGPGVVDRLRDSLLGGAADGLRQQAEGA